MDDMEPTKEPLRNPLKGTYHSGVPYLCTDVHLKALIFLVILSPVEKNLQGGIF